MLITKFFFFSRKIWERLILFNIDLLDKGLKYFPLLPLSLGFQVFRGVLLGI
jgi:hypothetical protein